RTRQQVLSDPRIGSARPQMFDRAPGPSSGPTPKTTARRFVSAQSSKAHLHSQEEWKNASAGNSHALRPMGPDGHEAHSGAHLRARLSGPQPLVSTSAV